MGKYRNETPANRTIIQGFWSDLMDLWRDSFRVDGEEVALKVSEQGDINLNKGLTENLRAIQETNASLLKEIRLLNARFEESFPTSIRAEDLENG